MVDLRSHVPKDWNSWVSIEAMVLEVVGGWVAFLPLLSFLLSLYGVMLLVLPNCARST